MEAKWHTWRITGLGKRPQRKSEIILRQTKIKTQVPKYTRCGKAIVRGKLRAIDAYIKKKKWKSLVNSLTLHLKKLEKKEWTESKVRRRKKKKKKRINEIKTRIVIEKKINETESCYLKTYIVCVCERGSSKICKWIRRQSNLTSHNY